MKNKTDADDKLAIMNRQLFNKRETIILPEESHESVPYSPVKESVLAGMLASFEKLGYRPVLAGERKRSCRHARKF